ncbi:baseplate J/gp47 family protein [Pasteurella multocida]|nr:baseplate J/gp47 family protein [Pasteurella multocida]HDR1874088.1 baseplate J/gp47 family protein [Pasteurella multocida]HDR1894448.1 baseplate J/gp47 family protein [Pasteurella multocida]HED4406655.1 baseplate J/gp47 family protein [Pasteurella multocida]
MAENFKTILQQSGLPLEESEIRQEFERLTLQENLITNTSKMSPFWRLITLIAIKPVMLLINALIEDVLPNIFVKTAKGMYLQLQAWSVGLDFKPATKAEGVVHFYRQTPTGNLKITAGTIVQAERINGVIYRLLVKEDTLIPDGSMVQAVPVVAEQEGRAYNLANGYYNILPEPINGIARVENLSDWLLQPGSDRETDEELRQRIRNAFSSVGQHHIDSVYKGMIANVAGLSIDRIYFKHNAPRGPGTANAYLLLDTGVASQPFVDKVNQYITDKGYHGHGDDLICYSMPETQHNLTCQVFFFTDLGLSEIRKQEIMQNVELMIRCAFRENANFNVTKTYPYQRFSWSRLGEEIHKSQYEIQSIVWGQADIVSELTIPRIEHLSVTRGN